MEQLDAGALVVVNCQGPREKIWGVLVRLDPVGVVVRGLDLTTVTDWLTQERTGGEKLIAPSTVFLPVHRIERIYVDESSLAAKSFGDRYAADGGGDVREALGYSTEE